MNQMTVSVVAQYPDLFEKYPPTHLPNLVLLSQNELLL